MRTLPDRKSYVRASRTGEKEERSRHIIDSAAAVLNDVRFEKFTLDRVAEKAGFSRGGIYKYFRTKEDLLLALHTQQMSAMTERLLRKAKSGMSDRAFAKAFLDSALADPLYLRILRRYEGIANENASDEALMEWWQFYRENMKRIIGYVSVCLDLDWDATNEAIWSITAMLMGASQMQSTQRGMRLDQAPLSEQKKAQNQLRELFLASAETTLRGLRSR